ncbi:WXG100 family type VII secretion target [Streptomyces sp. NPDC057456]|uniref:WXG100 family type VII secretion target n=1 Tax=Streptomyces sp. NPDC057456 TaxID=3346139 RepID=UPI0036780436
MADYNDGFIYVDYASMNNAAEDMIQQTRAISQILTDLDSELTSLKNSWEGDDRSVYDQKQASWHAAVEKMRQLLQSHSGLLTDVSDNYQRTERALTQSWEGVRIGR